MDANPPTSPTVGVTWLAGMVARGTLGRFKMHSQAVAVYVAFSVPTGRGVLVINAISQSSGISRRTVRRSLSEMERVGVLRLRRSPGVGSEVTLVHN